MFSSQKTITNSWKKPATHFVLIAAVISCLAGCGLPDSPVSASSLCRRMADTVGKRAESCDLGSYQNNYESFINRAANGDCSNIESVRDREALTDQCFTVVNNAPCDKLIQAIREAEACHNQLQRE
jgi:hypothetical protein